MSLEEANSTDHTWWGRPAGGRDVLRVAIPLVISSLSWTIMTFVDRMMLNWVSGAAMAAAFSAGMVWFGMLSLPLGICAYANTFVAQYDGAKQHERVGTVIWQAAWIALGLSPIVLAAIPLARPMFELADHGAEATNLEVEYFQILCVGGPALLIAQAASAFYSGRGETWVVMWTDSFFAGLNLVLDYLWIFGYAGFPEAGVAGAAWATVVSLWLKAVVYLLLPLQRAHREKFGTLRGLRFDRELLGRMCFYGGPSGLQMLLDVTGFTAFVLLIGRLGSVESAATSMAFSIGSLAFMPIYGMHMAVGVLVGERLGQNRDDLAARSTYTCLHISWLYMASISLLYVFWPELFVRWFYMSGTSLSEESIAVRDLVATLLRFVAAYNLLDATFMILVGAIKGAGDTVFLFRVSLILAVLLSTLSYLSVEVWNLGIYGCWMLIVGWLWIAAITFYLRFRQGKWRDMRVIESPGTNDDRAETGAESLAAAAE